MAAGQGGDALSLEGTSNLSQPSPSGDRLLDLLCSVLKMGTTSEKATSYVAYEYFRLGEEYIEYNDAKEDSPPAVPSQSFYKVAWPHLALLTKPLTRWT